MRGVGMIAPQDCATKLAVHSVGNEEVHASVTVKISRGAARYRSLFKALNVVNQNLQSL